MCTSSIPWSSGLRRCGDAARGASDSKGTEDSERGGCKDSIHLRCKETVKVPQVQFSRKIANVLNSQVMKVAREQRLRRDNHDLLTSRRRWHKGLVFGVEEGNVR